jgi:large subunit ribosomal protein L28
MSKVCQITGKKAMIGNNVSHSKHRTKRSFDVNLFSKKFFYVEEDCWISLKISAAGLRMINKVGLDAALKQAVGRGTFFIKGEGLEQLVEIKGCVPEKREDIVRLANKTTVAADVRWRPMFTNWYMDLDVAYNVNGLLTPEQIINMINLGGLVCGLGEWRPEKDGMYGMFHVEV